MSRVTLSRYLIEQTRSNNTPADLRFLIEVVARACGNQPSRVQGRPRRCAGSMGTENVQGEVQKKLDVISNDILLEANEWGGHLAGMASEEMDNAYQIPGKYPKGAYLLVFDPLDGSSNIDVNVSVGTIFSVLRCPNEYLSQNETLNENAFLQPGTQQVAAGYAIYGPQTMLILTLGNGGGFHPGPRAGQLRAYPREHPRAGNHRRVRHQHVQPAPLGSPGAASASCWQARPAR